MSSILVISQVYPFPLHDGGRVDVFYRLRALKSLGAKVTLLTFYNPAFGKPDVQPLIPYCEEIFPVPYLRRKLSKIFALRPYSVGSRENFSELQIIQEHLQSRCFDVIIAESHHVLSVANYFREQLKVSKLILRSHNNEPRFMFSLAQTSPLFSVQQAFFFVEALKYKLYESKLLSFLQPQDMLWHISFDELARYKKKYPWISQKFLPAAIEINKKRAIPRKGKAVLFIGALFSPNNLQGLAWYLKHIHPNLISRYEDYTLLVAGNTKGVEKKKLANLFSGLRCFSFVDTPENLEPYYENASVFINPMRYGAGVKLKTVQAALMGVPIVTTSCGNEGTGLQDGKHLMVRDSAGDFFQAIAEIFANEKKGFALASAAVDYLVKNYDQEKQLHALLTPEPVRLLNEPQESSSFLS